MNLERITTELQALFAARHRFPHDGRRVIFWYDPQAEFAGIWQALELAGVKKLHHDGAWFNLKYQLFNHHNQPHDQVLIYAPFAEPLPRHNPLYDVQATGLLFQADQANMVWQRLGLLDRALEAYLRQQRGFLADEAKVAALVDLGLSPNSDLAGLRLGMLAVLADLEIADAGRWLRQLLCHGTQEADNRLWQQALQFFDEEQLWQAVCEASGLPRQLANNQRHTLRRCFNALAVTHLRRRWVKGFPKSLEHFLIQPDSKAVSLVGNWLRDRNDAQVWQELAKASENDLDIEAAARLAGAEALGEADSFPAIERAVIRLCTEALMKNQAPTSPSANPNQSASAWVQERIRQRRQSHWVQNKDFTEFYHLLDAAARLMALAPSWQHLSHDSQRLWASYLAPDGLWQADRAYREFCAAFSELESKGADLVKELSNSIEQLYIKNYLEHLGEAWSEAFTSYPSVGNVASQLIPGRIALQERFFAEVITPSLTQVRTVVIISDGLRYEVAATLAEALANDRGSTQGQTQGQTQGKFDIDLAARLTELPSITSVGMAALLPGSHLGYDDNCMVLRDEKATNSTEARQKVLQASVPASIAMRESDFTPLKVTEARNRLQGLQVAYLYHNLIDTTGESGPQELDVPQAAARSIDELAKLIKRLIQSLNVSRVVVTADHGFLFQRRSLEDYEKLSPSKDGTVLQHKRRYLLGNGLSATSGSLYFASRITGISDVVVPRGSLRFMAKGHGMHYAHGGASLQEMAVPVLTIRPPRQKSGGVAQKVQVVLQSSNQNSVQRRITGSPFTITLMQLEPVSETMLARELSIGWFDEGGSPVTAPQIVRFDSVGQAPSERLRSLLIEVILRDPQRNSQYDLIIRDLDDGSELLREAWRIDLAIPDEFGL
jgi:uncharacterized protein (TIGR02687 family)